MKATWRLGSKRVNFGRLMEVFSRPRAVGQGVLSTHHVMERETRYVTRVILLCHEPRLSTRPLTLTMSTDPFELTLNGCTELQATITDEDESIGGDNVIQFLSVKKVGGGADRYRLIISDGIHFIQAMLATQCNYMVDNESITRFTVAAIERASCNLVQNKR